MFGCKKKNHIIRNRDDDDFNVRGLILSRDSIDQEATGPTTYDRTIDRQPCAQIPEVCTKSYRLGRKNAGNTYYIHRPSHDGDLRSAAHFSSIARFMFVVMNRC